MSLLTKKKYSFTSTGMDKGTFTVVSFKGFEAISKPYKFDILLVSKSTGIDPLKVLQNPAVFTIHRDEEEDVQFNGILMQFEETQEFDGYLFFKAVLTPKLWWLSLTHHNQVFLDLSAPEIIENALKDGGLNPGIDFSFNLMNSYQPHEYICQYDESHFNFVSRWAEREGMYYFFEQTSAGEKIIFTDSKMEHKDLLLGKDLIYLPQSGLDALHTKEVIQNFLCRHNLLPQKVYLKDYNYLKPSFSIEGMADVDENGRGENYVYGVNFDTPEEGNRLAKIRAEALVCRKSVFHGESSVPFIVPGYTFDLNDHYKRAYNRKYLVSEVTHEGHQTGYLLAGLSKAFEERDEAMFYRNSFTAIYSDEQFRVEHLSEKPKISGTINAKIDAAGSGEHAELDEYGRYKVILPFDRSGRSNGKASAFFRMMQPSAGQNQGMHFPLHKGTEVLLTFIDGNPDRPVIAGAMPNPETSSPVKDGNQTQSLISTGKSPVNQSVGAAEKFGINAAGNWRKNQNDNFIEFEDALASRRIGLSSKGNLWFEAQDRYGEYHTKEAYNTFSDGSEPKINDLMGKFDKITGSYMPTKMLERHDPGTTQASFHDDVFQNAHVHVSSMDTVSTQEGNIYDFGGYWNYNLGNSYAEDYLDQKAELNKTRPRDLLDKGGPSWYKVDWDKGLDNTTSMSEPIEAGDIEIGSSGDWEATAAGGPTNAWVSKQFGRSYSYSEGDSIEVAKGDSLTIGRGGKHIEVGFRGSGSMKSWSWSSSGVKKEKKWNSAGGLLYKMEADVSDGITEETQWNPYPGDSESPNKISEKTEDDNSGTVSETTYCRDHGDMIAYSSKHQGARSVHTYDYNWANTASASINFAAGAAFSLNMSEQGEINIFLSAVQSLNFGMSSEIELNFKSGFNASFNFPCPTPFGVLPLTSFELDMSSLKMEVNMAGLEIKLAGIELKKKSFGIDLEDEGEKLKLRRRGMRLEGSQLNLLQEQLRLHV